MKDSHENYRRFVYYCWGQFRLRMATSHSEDLLQEAWVGLSIAKQRFDSEHVSHSCFMTFARYHIDGAMWDYLHRWEQIKRADKKNGLAFSTVQYDPESDDRRCERPTVIETIDNRQRAKRVLEQLTPTQRHVFELRYLNDYTPRETAVSLGISKGRVSQIIAEGLKNISFADLA